MENEEWVNKIFDEWINSQGLRGAYDDMDDCYKTKFKDATIQRNIEFAKYMANKSRMDLLDSLVDNARTQTIFAIVEKILDISEDKVEEISSKLFEDAGMYLFKDEFIEFTRAFWSRMVKKILEIANNEMPEPIKGKTRQRIEDFYNENTGDEEKPNAAEGGSSEVSEEK